MKILFIGDISGKPGRETVKNVLPEVVKQEKIDFVIANCENAAHGRGVTREIISELQAYGVDYFTSGDHIWDQREFINEMYDQNLPLVRFYNYEGGEAIPGKSYEIIDVCNEKVVIASFGGISFTRFVPRNPFWAADIFFKELKKKGITNENSIIIIDFHGEATAEKLSFAEYVKDRASAVIGTHTHVGTVDIQNKGDLAYVTDVGMVGPMESSLWVDFEDSIHNFKFPNRKNQTMKEGGKKIFNSVILDFALHPVGIKRLDRVL